MNEGHNILIPCDNLLDFQYLRTKVTILSSTIVDGIIKGIKDNRIDTINVNWVLTAIILEKYEDANFLMSCLEIPEMKDFKSRLTYFMFKFNPN